MQIDDFLQLLRKRRSIRRFKPDPIPDESIEKILEAGRWAMSGANGQPWEFIVVKNQETKDKIGDLYVEALRMTYAIEKTRIEELRHPAGLTASPSAPGFEDAPVILIVCGDLRTYQATVLVAHFAGSEGGSSEATYFKSMANATHNLQLAAAALGLGSQWVSVSGILNEKLKPILGVPPELKVHTIVPIGYPAHGPPTPYRRELKEMVHFEKYDMSKFRSHDEIFKFLLNLRRRSRYSYPMSSDVSDKRGEND